MAQCEYVSEEKGRCQAHRTHHSSYCYPHEKLVSAQQPPEPAQTRASLAEEPAEPKRRRGGRPEPERPEVDPMVVGGAIQQLLLKQEVSDRLRVAQARQKARDKDGFEMPEAPRPMPWKVVPRRRSADPTLPIDPTTNEPPAELRRDWMQRWVRERDHMDRPTQARVAEFKEYGYEIVKNSDGSDCRGRLGVLMQGPPEQYALRASEKTPKGAVQRDEALLLAMDMAEAANRIADSEVTRVVVSDEHRSERLLVGAGVERADD